jgi:Glycosyl transferase family 2
MPLMCLAHVHEYTDKRALTAWLTQLPWSNAWLQSNRVMFILFFLIYQAEHAKQEQAPALVHHILDWLDSWQDPVTGMWGTDHNATALNAMAATYHFLPFYQYVRRPIAHTHRIIDATIQLQQPDGLFGAGIGGGACEDLDAIDVLALLTAQTHYRSNDIKRVLQKAFHVILANQNLDGSFGYTFGSTETYRYSSWAIMESHLSTGDTWATWFRLLALATIQRLYPDDLPLIGSWQFRRWPALGYHRWGNEETEPSIWARQLTDTRMLIGDPSISVVIPCYNLGLYLYEAVESALAQTLSTVEVIIVDDGSTDQHTRHICDQLAEHPRVQLLRQENRGLPAARNAGIQIARAPLICCLDADDRLRPTFLERAQELLQNPQVGFVSCFYQEFDGRHGVIQHESCGLPEMLWMNHAMVASLFRRDAWARVGGYCETMRGMHDWDFWIGILEAGYQGAVIPEVLFEYRIRDGSMYSTSSKPENYARLVQQIVERHPTLYQQWQPQVIAGWAHAFANLVAYADGQGQLAREYHQQARTFAEIQKRAEMADGLSREVESWRKIAEDRAYWVTQLEAARDFHHQQAQNWETSAIQAQDMLQSLSRQHETLLQEQERLLSEGLIAHMRRQIRRQRLHRQRRRRESS